MTVNPKLGIVLGDGHFVASKFCIFRGSQPRRNGLAEEKDISVVVREGTERISNGLRGGLRHNIANLAQLFCAGFK